MAGRAGLGAYRKPAVKVAVQRCVRRRPVPPRGGVGSPGRALRPQEMKNSLVGSGTRKLVYLPIIHTAADMGTLGASIRGRKLSTLGRQGLKVSAAVVDKIWEEMERVVSNLPVPPGTVRVYQDGLPVCGREQEIITELAETGHRNHRLLLKLQVRGAMLKIGRAHV